MGLLLFIATYFILQRIGIWNEKINDVLRRSSALSVWLS